MICKRLIFPILRSSRRLTHTFPTLLLSRKHSLNSESTRRRDTGNSSILKTKNKPLTTRTWQMPMKMAMRRRRCSEKRPMRKNKPKSK